MAEAAAWPIALGVLGTIIGSFIAALVIRWPDGRSVTAGRSACDACGRTLGARDLVPLLSGLAQRGRCRTCGVRIDPRHWRIEAAAGVIGVAAGCAIASPVALAGAVFGWLLLTLAALDMVAMWLPDRLTITLALGGVLTGAVGVAPAMSDRLIGGAAGFAALWLIAFGYRRVRGREGMGGGDPKLMGGVGLWLGWAPLPGVLLGASIIGLGVALVEKARGKPVGRDTALPLGALIAVAAYPTWLVVIGWHS